MTSETGTVNRSDEAGTWYRPTTWWSGPVGRFLTILIVVYIAKQAISVVAFPPFTGHDEVAHFNYIATVTDEHRVPVLLQDEIPDYYYRYCQYILDWAPCEPDNSQFLLAPFRFANWGSAGIFAAGEQYVGNHPPLYYLMMAPIFRLSESASPETQQYILRFAAIPFGIATVLLAWLLARTLFPGDTFLAITLPTVVAFQPQISYEAAMVNNDIVAIAFTSAVLLYIVYGIRDRFPKETSLMLGFLLGLAVISKSTSLVMIPIIALAMVATLGLRNVRGWLTSGLIAGGIATVIVAPWYFYLWRTYGNLDALPQVEEMQQPWNHPAGTWQSMLTSTSFTWKRWSETWGEFGWRRIPLDDWLLWVIAVPVLIGVAGLLLYAWKCWVNRRDVEVVDPVEHPARWQVISLTCLLLTCVISYLLVIQFGTRFALTQARYFFPVVNAATLLVLLGGRTLIPNQLRPLGRGAIVSGMIMLTVVIFIQYVIPYWYVTNWDLLPG